MERRTLIIGANAGGIGLLEYSATVRWMRGIGEPPGFSVKEYERFGANAALKAITPNDDFYITSKGPTPKISAADWQLRFDGLVKHAFSLSYKELLALP